MGRELRRWILIGMLLLGLGAAIVLSEQPRGSLAGQVSVSEGTPFPSSVQAIASGPVVRGVYVGDDGRYTIPNLPAGRYQVQVIAPGYERDRLGDRFLVREGQVEQLPDAHLQRLTPALNLYGTSQVFTTAEAPQVHLSSSGLDTVQVEIYRFPLVDYLGSSALVDLADPYGYSFEPSPDIASLTLIRSWQQAIAVANEDGWAAITLDLPKLDAGAYWVKTRASRSDVGALTAGYWFMVTDLGLIQKQAADQMVIEAINLSTLQPMAGVDLQLYAPERQDELILKSMTDVEGLARIPIPEAYRDVRQWVIYGSDTQTGFQALSRSSFYGYRDTRFFTYTDRPLYRPGQTVYFRSIIRQIDPQQGPRPVQGSQVQVRVTSPKGDPIQNQSLDLSEFGSVHGEFTLPTTADLGSYEIELTTESGENHYHFLSVEEYRKPEFEVTVTPEHPWIRQGESVDVSVEAEYLFGGPVAGAEVHYIVYRSSDWGYRYDLLSRSPEESFFATELESERYGYYGGYGEVILEGDAITDQGGVARLRLDRLLQNFDWQKGDSYFGETPVQQLRIEAQVTDISRRAVTQDGRLRVTQGDFALFLEGDQYVAEPGQTVSYRIRSLGYDGAPLSVQGQLLVEEWQWDSRQEHYRKVRTVSSTPFNTQQGEGAATVTLPPDLPTGDYRIRAEASDRHGNPVRDDRFLWVIGSDSGHSGWSRGQATGLQITPDQQVYEAGDTARVVIASPLPDSTALVTLEGATLYEAKLQPIDGSVAVVEVPILERYQPNVYVSVILVGPNRQIYQQEQPLWVSPLNRFLSVEIETDRDQYLPGQTAQVTVRTRGADGQPVSAEVSLGAVDEAIYILKDDQTPDIRRFFYRRRYNQVSTTYSFPQQYPGGLDKLANQLRQTFEDTAAWFPSLVTDAQGQTTVEIQLPDNLTTWRLTAMAATADTQVGSALERIRVSKDLLVRLATPRFFSTGDRLQLTAVVQNQTDRPLVADVQLQAPSTLNLEGERSRRIQLAPQSAQRLEWPTQVLAAGDTTVQVSAQAGDLQDAMQLTIPAQAYGATYRIGEQGALTGSESEVARLDLTVPDSVVPGSIRWTLQLASNPAANLLGALDYLVGYPYGCTEQTLSRFLPSLAVAEAAETLGLPLRAQTLENLPTTIEEGLARLAQMQNPDGGWGWWRSDGSNPDLTSYVLMGYHRARSAGYPVGLEQEEQGIQFLEDVISDSKPLDPDSLMFTEYGLSLFGRADLEQVRRIDPQGLSTFGKAYRTLALLRLGDRQSAQAALGDLLQQVSRDNGFVWFQMAERTAAETPPLWHRYSYQEVEIAGPVLIAATDLGDPRADQIASWILNMRGGGRWLTTKATADAIVGLTRYYASKATKTTASYEVSIRNLSTGAVLGRWSPDWDQSRQVLDLAPRDLGSETLQPGPQTIEIEKTGSGPLYYTLSFESAVAADPEEILGGEAHGFTVRRQYYTLSPRTQEDGTLVYEQHPLRGAVPAGEVLLGQITVDVEADSNYVMIEEPLPSGAEITSQDPRQLTGRDSEQTYWWNWFWTHQEVRDDRITFFSTELPRGKHEFIYLFRPEIPGEFTIAPTLAEEMYDPTQVYGQGRSTRLTVKG